MHIPSNIKTIRKLIGETQEEFRSRFTGTTLSMQKSYEQGVANPGPLYVSELADIAGVTEKDIREKTLGKNDIDLQKVIRAGAKKDEKEENGAHGTSASGKIAIITEGTIETDLFRAIITLTESNKGLVESNQAITATNQVIADTNAILAQKLVNQPTVSEDQQTLDETVAMVIALRESLVEINAGMKKISKTEASQEFHRKVKDAMIRLGKKDNLSEASKQSTK